jgi:hypothetical protein
MATILIVYLIARYLGYRLSLSDISSHFHRVLRDAKVVYNDIMGVGEILYPAYVKRNAHRISTKYFQEPDLEAVE